MRPNKAKILGKPYGDGDGDGGYQRCEMVCGRRLLPTVSLCQNKAEFFWDHSLVAANILSACWI